MKKYILIACSGLLLFSCANKKTEEAIEAAKADSLSRPENVSTVAAIGKIEPMEGMVEIAAEKGGIVSKVYKLAGEKVKKNELLIALNADLELSNENTVRAQVTSRQKQAQADATLITQYEVQLREKEKDLAASERLVRTGAETQQNVDIKRRERDVILANLKNARANAAASRSQVNEAVAQLNEAKAGTGQMYIRASKTGMVVTMDAKPGQAVNALTPFATIAPDGQLVVHGEIDEMFAARVSTGDTVEIRYPGNAKLLAKGTVIELSPVLEDKSLFYEKAGEASDRRVRRFKASIEHADNLLINEKVEAVIHLQNK